MSNFDGLKQFFGEDGNTAITYEQLSKGITEKGIKLADLSLGEYVAKDKYEELVRKFNDYKTKNDVSKYADYDTIKSKLETLEAEKTDRDCMDKLSEKKVKPEFKKFVLNEIKNMVTEEKPFDKAMEEYLTENLQYISRDEGNQSFFKNSSVPLGNGSGDIKSDYQKLNDQIRGVR